MEIEKPSYSVSVEEQETPNLSYYLGLFYRHRIFLFTFFFITTSLALIFLMKIPNQYRAVAQVLIESAPISAGATEELQATHQSYTYVDTQAEIISSVPILTVASEKEKLVDFFKVSDLKEAVFMLKKIIKVKAIRGTQLINISVQTANAQKSAAIANQIAETYVKQSIQNRLFFSKEIIKLLPEGTSEESIKNLTPLGQLEQLDKEEFAATLPSVKSNPTIMELSKQIAKAEADLFELKRQYREQHPEVAKLQANLEFLKESVDVQTKRVIHELKTALTNRLQVSDVRIVQPAEAPLYPVGPMRLRLLLFILLIELLVSFGLVIFVDYLDDRVKNQDDVEKFVRLPYLGHAPILSVEDVKDAKKRYFYVHEHPQSDIAEALRYIRVGINFSAPPDMLRAFAITSSVPQEGKSFCSCNLAASFALDGNRVLLVDADNRRPVLHTVFGLENKNGLTNYLTSNIPLESVVRKTHVPGLDFVPTGPESPNPSELLGSAKMAEFIEKAKSQYDRVIVDAPPLIGIGDGLVLGRLIGHLIFVIRSHQISRKVIKQVREKLQHHQIKVLGVILNYLDMEKDKYGYYRYHYHTYNRYYGKSAQKKHKEKERRNKKETS